MTEQGIRVWAASEQGIENDQPLETFPAPKPAREVLEVLRQHYSGDLMRKDDNVTLIGDDVVTAGDYVYYKTQGAAAGAGSTSVLQEGGLGPVTRPLHELICALHELVQETKELRLETKELRLEKKATNALLRVMTHILRKQFAQQFRYTTSQATKFRSPGFTHKLIKVYGSESAENPGKVWCNAVGQWVHRELVVGTHLFKFAWRTQVHDVLGFSNINDPANGLMLLKPVAEAFDVGYICFIWEGIPGTARTQGVYRIRWLGGPNVPIAGGYPWQNPSDEGLNRENKKLLLELKNEAGGPLLFSDLDGKALEFKTTARPYRRCLVFQARYALKQAISEGRIAEEQLAEIAPKLVAASAKSANLELYWERFYLEEQEPPPQPVDTCDLLSEKEPDSASDGGEESEEGHQW